MVLSGYYVVVPNPKFFLWISASAGDVIDVNRNNMFLASGSACFIIFSGQANLLNKALRYPLNYIILDIWIFDEFLLTNELVSKSLWRIATSLLVSNNVCGQLVSWLELPIIFDRNLEVISISFFIVDFNLFNCEFDNYTFTLSHWFVLILVLH